MSRSGRRSLVSALIAALLASPAALAANAPSDPCSLLSASEVSKAVGDSLGAPARSVAPRPFPNTVQGTDCLYEGRGGREGLQFRIYFDPSASGSAELFKRLEMYFGPVKAVPGVGDEAYFDQKHGLHARKGNVRFYMSLDGTSIAPAAREKLLGSLGAGIAGRL